MPTIYAKIASGDVIADILEPHLELIQCLDDILPS